MSKIVKINVRKDVGVRVNNSREQKRKVIRRYTHVTSRCEFQDA